MEPNLSELDYATMPICKKRYMYEIAKRIVDITGAVFGITLFSPVFIITAIAIKIDSNGPVFYSQARCGRNGAIFKMYKFRSMLVNADQLLEGLRSSNQLSGPVFKMMNDPRITRVGRFIRKTSIDELPQLVNVLLGDMSLVGPRPPIRSEVLGYNPYQMQRLLIKPGITCYWQVMGRSSIGFEKWVELDLKYMNDRNLWVDLKLIIKTLTVFFGDENAW